MNYTYAQMILCPRCGQDGVARVEATKDDSPDERLVRVFCDHWQCTFYGRAWFFVIDPQNVVQYHTHTPFHEKKLEL